MPFGTGKATLEMTGEHNRNLILQLLRRYGQLSRQQLSDMTTLHRSTLSKIMSEFLDRDLVRVVGKIEPAVKRVGKKQILLRIREDVGWALGIGLNWEWVNMVILDAAGRLVAQSRVHLGRDLARLPQVAKAHLDSWLRDRGRPAGKALGVGVGIPGVVDIEKGTVVLSDFFKVQNCPLALQLSEALGLPVSIDNDVRLEAMAQLNQPNETGTGDFIFFHTNYSPVETGYVIYSFGSAIVIDGHLHRGSHYGAGELWGLLQPPQTNVVTEEDLTRLNSESAPLTENLCKVVEFVAPYLATVAGFVDPRRIIMGGAMHWRNRAVLERLEARVNDLLQPAIPNRRIEVQSTLFPGQETAYGAALLALAHVPVSKLRGPK